MSHQSGRIEDPLCLIENKEGKGWQWVCQNRGTPKSGVITVGLPLKQGNKIVPSTKTHTSAYLNRPITLRLHLSHEGRQSQIQLREAIVELGSNTRVPQLFWAASRRQLCNLLYYKRRIPATNFDLGTKKTGSRNVLNGLFNSQSVARAFVQA